MRQQSFDRSFLIGAKCAGEGKWDRRTDKTAILNGYCNSKWCKQIEDGVDAPLRQRNVMKTSKADLNLAAQRYRDLLKELGR